jgi:hypothetical protein
MFAGDDVFDVEIFRLHGEVRQAAVFAAGRRPLSDEFPIRAGHAGPEDLRWRRAFDCNTASRPRNWA